MCQCAECIARHSELALGHASMCCAECQTGFQRTSNRHGTGEDCRNTSTFYYSASRIHHTIGTEGNVGQVQFHGIIEVSLSESGRFLRQISAARVEVSYHTENDEKPSRSRCSTRNVNFTTSWYGADRQWRCQARTTWRWHDCIMPESS